MQTASVEDTNLRRLTHCDETRNSRPKTIWPGVSSFWERSDLLGRSPG